jgi:hypothetical protein
VNQNGDYLLRKFLQILFSPVFWWKNTFSYLMHLPVYVRKNILFLKSKHKIHMYVMKLNTFQFKTPAFIYVCIAYNHSHIRRVQFILLYVYVVYICMFILILLKQFHICM